MRLFARRLKQERRCRIQTKTVPKTVNTNTLAARSIIRKASNCFNMAPWRGCWGVPGRLGELLGTRSAPRGSRHQLWRPPGAEKRARGTPRGETLIDFRFFGTPRRAAPSPRARNSERGTWVPESDFRTSFRGHVSPPQNKQQQHRCNLIHKSGNFFFLCQNTIQCGYIVDNDG